MLDDLGQSDDRSTGNVRLRDGHVLGRKRRWVWVLVVFAVIVVLLVGTLALFLVKRGSMVRLASMGRLTLSAEAEERRPAWAPPYQSWVDGWWARPADVEKLELASATDDDLAYIERLPNLILLDLSNAGITDEGIVHLQRLTNLQYLELAGTRITDSALSRLKGLPNLRELGLRNTSITDKGLAQLGRLLPNLEFLILTQTAVTDSGLAELSAMTKLNCPGLRDTLISDSGLAHLKSLPELRTIHLDGTRITDTGVALLMEFKALSFVTLGHTGITDDGLIYLASCTNLVSLVLNDTPVTDAGLVHLRSLTDLKLLNLQNTVVTDSGIGMDEETLTRIFDRFYRGDPSRSTAGHGLGLSLVRAVVQSHAGRTTVTSRPGEGSQFVVLLPRHAPSADPDTDPT